MHYSGNRFKVKHIKRKNVRSNKEGMARDLLLESISTGRMFEAIKRGMARDLLLEKKIRLSARFCEVRIFFKSR